MEEQNIYYLLNKYTKSTLYPTLPNRLSSSRSDLPAQVLVYTVPANSQQTLIEFTTPLSTILVEDMWTVNLDLYAIGNQSTKNARIAVQLLKNGVSVYTTDFTPVPYDTAVGRLSIPIYIPGVSEKDQITLRVLGKSANNHAYVFYLYVHDQYTYMKK
jgi:hypothetical protein